MTNPDIQVAFLLQLIDQAYDHPTWHGPNLLGALKGVKPEEALWRPASGRHNIWEYTLHCAYWKHMVTRHLRGDLSRGNFPRKPANFPALPEPSPKAWKADLELLQHYHLRLREAVQSLRPDQLDHQSGRWTLAEYAFGAANHDIYHAGQIRLLRRLYRG